MENLIFHRESAVRKPIVVSGMKSSGKSLILGLLNCFSDTPFIFKDFRLGHICQLATCDALRRDLAVLMLRYSLDFNWYDLRIGRGLNFRLNDETSIWSYHNVGDAFQAIASPKGALVFDAEKQFAAFDIHNAILHTQVLSEAYDEVTLINVYRSPGSVIFSWIRDGFFDDSMLLSATSQMLSFQFNGTPIPLFAANWKEEYVQMTQADRSFRIYKQIMGAETSIRKNGIPSNIQLFDLSFEEATLKPNGALSVLSDALQTKANSFVNEILLKERVPRKYDQTAEDQKIKEVSGKLSPENKVEFLDLMQNFRDKRHQ